jgi:hypothetical protein
MVCREHTDFSFPASHTWMPSPNIVSNKQNAKWTEDSNKINIQLTLTFSLQHSALNKE